MKKVGFLLFILFQFISISQQQMSCNNDESCPVNFICKYENCVHKGLFPIEFEEITLLFIMLMLSLVATTAGIGGGVVYASLFMFFCNFHAKQAFSTSNLVIFFCSCTTFYVGIKKKLNNPQLKFVDFNLAAIFCPTQLLGTKIGVILNKIFPEIFLNLIFLIVLSISIYKTYINAIKQKLKEDSLKTMFHFELKKQDDMLIDERGRDDPKETVPPDALFEDKYPIKKDIIKNLFLLEFILIIDQLVEGNVKFGSIIGIKKCSIFYWILFISFAVFCVYVAKYFIQRIKREAEANLNRVTESFRISRQEREVINDIMFKCFLGGMVAGMLGIGGAVILTPLMLQLKVDPIVATSTSNFLLILTSSTASILFMLGGDILYDYAIFYAILCGIASLIGSIYIKEYIDKTKKLSVLIFFILGLMIVSLLLLPINSIRHIMNDIDSGISLFGFRNFC